jgi:hypothetical protein
MTVFCVAFISAAEAKGGGGRPTHGCAQAQENDGDPYDSTCDGSPSQNGNGGGNASGKPCAGCVGAADNKNPKGQYPDGSDHNNGYECDGNNGVGKGNPAHTACEPYSGARIPGKAKTIQARNANGFLFEQQSSERRQGQVGLFAITAVALLMTTFYLRRGGKRKTVSSS